MGQHSKCKDLSTINVNSTETRKEREIVHCLKMEKNTMAQLYTNVLLRGESIAVRTT